MIIKNEDIFKTKNTYNAICVTTNGIVKKDGRLVMGAGVAFQFAKNFPGLDYELGQKVLTYGNRPFLVFKKNTAIVSFPTKSNWKDKSDKELIKFSAKNLVKIAQSRFWTKIALPAPGVGKGELNWSKDVYPILNPILDNRFHILFYNK
tara:strand:- start:350 stop:796 length:447 start_codon:yes stop_codon:yes gene_type:complete